MYSDDVKNLTSRRTIEPIWDSADIAKLRMILRNKPRDLLLFDLAVQTGLRLKDLLLLKVKDLVDLEIGDRLPIPYSGSAFPSAPFFTKTLYETFRWFLQETGAGPEDYLFRSRKGSRPLNLSSASHLVRTWFEAAGLKGLSGASSLRKTWEISHNPISSPGKVPSESGDPIKALKPIDATTVQEEVYKELFKAIISGQIPPGKKLVAERIAARMRVSQMPVRQALNKLQAIGLVSYQKKRGSIVKELSADNLKEITEIRLELESMAAAKAAALVSDKTVDQMSAIHEKYIETKYSNDLEAFLPLNKEFHYSIYRAAGMPILFEIIDGLWVRISPYLYILMRELVTYESIWTIKTHQGMLDGMRRRDPEMVIKWLRTDLTKGFQSLINGLRIFHLDE